MTLKTIVAAATLAVLPVMGFAQCAGDHAKMDQQAMTCMPNTTWDAEAGVCVPVASS